jgi:hypothetical protein
LKKAAVVILFFSLMLFPASIAKTQSLQAQSSLRVKIIRDYPDLMEGKINKWLGKNGGVTIERIDVVPDATNGRVPMMIFLWFRNKP